MKKVFLLFILSFTILLFITACSTESDKNIKSYDEEILGIEWVKVEGGEFEMGDNFKEGERDEFPVHTVNLDTYYISKYEVTVGQFKIFVNDTGYVTEAKKINDGVIFDGSEWLHKSDANWKNPYLSQTDSHPVVLVSYIDAKAFCDWLSKKTGRNIHLPTEAQWEYAARGGNKSAGYKYSGSNNLDEVAWYYNNSDHKTHPVGQKQPNELGIYDMSGNVSEWCSDWYAKHYYSISPRNNPKGFSNSSALLYRVVRGGSWDTGIDHDLSSSSRSYWFPSLTYTYNNLGFRLARSY